MDHIPNQDRPGSTRMLLSCYEALLSAFGHQGWWPSEGWFETMAGAVLAQNVSWSGASRAVCGLKEAGILSPRHLAQADPAFVASCIRSSRFYHQKTKTLQGFARWFLERYDGELEQMQQEDTGILREALLSLPGMGPETVDSILLYACGRPVFVVDAYTRRIGCRTGWFLENVSYHTMQTFFSERLPPDSALYNDFHAQIVHLGNTTCTKNPHCTRCPIRMIVPCPAGCTREHGKERP